ncbi:hypothetical protein IF1G_01496 [Cordyceps javanica]|uniref:Uncharacterized protein n=1 Tax=Cordyceps javanica TaxID=43265 RepID=A0A545WAN0_9HYPO|nr:hypothetical protein IF1G_01496 [Cordyceps javanica]TQW11043.1 hypothetical protein IF2G_01985 [Cordyceps javanica]
MASKRAKPRRFKTIGVEHLPYTDSLAQDFERRKKSGTLRRDCDPASDSHFRDLREGSHLSDFDHAEFCVERQEVDLTFVYRHHDIERPTRAQLSRLAPSVRRGMQSACSFPQTPRDVLYHQGPALAPEPRIPDPYDDEPEMGFRDTYMWRPRATPGVEKNRSKKTNKTRKRRRSGSEHSQDTDVDVGQDPKRPRSRYEEPETQDGPRGLDPSLFPPTPAATPPSTASYDDPMPTIEHSPAAVAQADAGILALGLFMNGQQPPSVSSSTSSTPTSPSSSPSPAPSSESEAALAPLSRSLALRDSESAPRVRYSFSSSSPSSVVPLTAAAAADPGPPSFAEDGFFALPHTVRVLIYEHLLNLALRPAILATCRRAHREGAAVLYGANEFLYLLRDGANRVADVVAAAYDDSPHLASDAEEQPAWGPARRVARRGHRRAGPAPLEKSDINLDRYICRFRRIAVEAEHNRFDQEAQARAAAAVQVFTERYPWWPWRGDHDHDRDDRDDRDPEGEAACFRTRLASIQLRVVPMWEAPAGGAGPRRGFFTFLDWFGRETALMRAVKELSCDKLTVRLLPPPRANAPGRSSRRRRMAAGAGGAGGAGDASHDQGPPVYTHEVGMVDYQAGRLTTEFGVADPWAADEAMQRGREARVDAMAVAFADLQRVLGAVCRDDRYGKRGAPKGGGGGGGGADGSVQDNDGDDAASEDGSGDDDGDETEEDEEISIPDDDAEDGDYEE